MNDSSGHRRLVLVVGAGRSGTSLTAGLFSQLGFHVPQPEVAADFTNPRGFREPRWVVDFHKSLMKQREIALFDARPAAWVAAQETAERPEVADRLLAWLAPQFAAHERIVVKDPRTVWFLPLWRRCADELGARTHYVTTLRHPTEVLRSIRTTAGNRQTEASRAAWWIATMLNTERATRGQLRAYMLYENLLADWRAELTRVEQGASLPLLTGADETTLASVDDFVDPTLRRSAAGWDDVDVPCSVQQLADQIWNELMPLCGSDHDETQVTSRLDGLHETYERFYAEAEAIADSSVIFAVRTGAKRSEDQPPGIVLRLKRRLPPRLRARLGKVKRAVTGARAPDGVGQR